MLSMASQDSERSSTWSVASESELDSSGSSTCGEDLEVEEIDDLMDLLVVEATKLYAVDTICSATTAENKRIVFTPEQQLINVAIRKLTLYNLKDEDAGKSYYELRIVADPAIFVASHSLGYDLEDISSVLIGYACLDGIDNSCHVRKFAFQDSQHLFKLCEVLGQRGRFEDAAF